MAPIKFEEQLKDKLNNRSLQPSADSWAKLSERLDAEEKKSRSPWFWWMGIAAAVAVMIAVVVQTFNSETNETLTPHMVEEDVIEENLEPKQPNLNEVKATELAVEDEQIDSQPNNKETLNQAQIVDSKSVANVNTNDKTQLATATTIKDKKLENSKELNKTEAHIIEEPSIIENAVAKAIEEFKIENTTVTDREVDSLLKLASKELFKDKLKKDISKTVDANLLLQDVEEEMGQSFRTKVYEALKESFETVKTAVAERNN